MPRLLATHLNVWFVLGPQRLLGRDPAAALTLKTWRVTMSVKVEQRTNINMTIGKETQGKDEDMK